MYWFVQLYVALKNGCLNWINYWVFLEVNVIELVMEALMSDPPMVCLYKNSLRAICIKSMFCMVLRIDKIDM